MTTIETMPNDYSPYVVKVTEGANNPTYLHNGYFIARRHEDGHIDFRRITDNRTGTWERLSMLRVFARQGRIKVEIVSGFENNS